MAALRARLRRGRAADGGFTLIELTLAMAFSVVAFAALGMSLGGSLKAIAVQKVRIRGNEVATQGIEDLQRFTYDGLGVCASASATPPEGLSSTVLLPNCPSPASTSYGEDPCTTTTGQPQVPKAVYACSRLGTTFTVSRYVAWNDSGHTTKHLAVFVDWTDVVGHHQVSQQSSIRSPTVASIIGLSAPTLSSAVVSPSTVQIVGGVPQSAISLSASATGLLSTDKVFVTFLSLDASGNPQVSSVFLTSADGVSWAGTINTTDGYLFGTGSQFFSFSTIRASDGKANAVVTSATTKFCTPSDSSCSSSQLPAFTSGPTVPSSVAINPDGSLKNDINVSITSKNMTTLDDVSVSLQAVSGLFSVFLQPDLTQSCTTSSCVWKGTIPASAGYKFAGGPQKFYFTGEQVVSPLPLSVDKGSTVATASGSVTFS
jgi:type II secretory pathway pseudopilin PulG